MKIQLGEEESIVSEEPKPVEFSTPLKIEEINEIYDREKTDYLKIAMKLNQTDLESASEVADSENETLIQEIINPTPGLVVNDDKILIHNLVLKIVTLIPVLLYLTHLNRN